MTTLSASLPPRRCTPACMLSASALVPLLMLAILAVMAFVEPRMFSRINLLNVCRNASLATLLALGQMLVMVVGGLDMSVGAVVAMGSVVAAAAMSAGVLAWPGQEVWIVSAGLIAALASGALVGAVNGVLVAFVRIPPFMTTLAVGSSLAGAVFYFTKGSPIYGLPEIYTEAFGRGQWLGLPIAAWVALVVAVALGWIIWQWPFGRHLLAVGGSLAAARASGIGVERVLLTAYVGSGVLAACAGVLLTARIGSGQATLGATAALESIAACVIGGVALRGGAGQPWRVVSAAWFLALLANALNLSRIDSKWQTALLGIALLGAVGLEIRARRATGGPSDVRESS